MDHTQDLKEESRISYVDIAGQNLSIQDELMEAFSKVMAGGKVILGEEVVRFEEELSRKHGLPWAVGVSSGTEALFLTLKALGIGPDDEVITAPNTFVATVAAIIHVGAKPVFADVDSGQTLDPAAIEAAIGSKTRAIVPVHLHGRPARMDEIIAIAARRDLVVIEDCAQAIGARLHGQTVGSFGVAGCYSLHPLKNLGALGDAGAVVGESKELLDTLKLLRNHGLPTRDSCELWGFNARLDSLQAAFLQVKLKHLDVWTKDRQRNAERYLTALKGLPVVLPFERPGEECVWHGFVIQTPARDELRKYLDCCGIETLIYYPRPIHLQPAAKDLGYSNGSFPVAERQAKQILSLPVRHDLKKGEIERVIEAIRTFFFR